MSDYSWELRRTARERLASPARLVVERRLGRHASFLYSKPTKSTEASSSRGSMDELSDGSGSLQRTHNSRRSPSLIKSDRSMKLFRGMSMATTVRVSAKSVDDKRPPIGPGLSARQRGLFSVGSYLSRRSEKRRRVRSDALPTYVPGIPYGFVRNRLNENLSDASWEASFDMGSFDVDSVASDLSTGIPESDHVERSSSSASKTASLPRPSAPFLSPESMPRGAVSASQFRSLLKRQRREAVLRLQLFARQVAIPRAREARALQLSVLLMNIRRHDSALLIQQWYLSSYRRRRAAVIQIQQHFRLHNARKLSRKLLEARSKIQKVLYSFALKKRRSVYMIQKAYRSWTLRQGLVTLRIVTIQIQSAVRTWLWRRVYQRKLNAALVVQKRMRHALVLKSLIRVKRRLHDRDARAATMIQKYARMSVYLSRYYRAKAGIIRLAAQVRRWCVQREVARVNSAATRISSAFRAYQIRLLRDISARLIQSAWKLHSFRVERHMSATVIQSYWRGYSARQFLIVSFIQAVVRGWQVRVRVEAMVHSIIRLQTLVRRRQATKRIKAGLFARRILPFLLDYQQIRAAATRIQSGARVWLARRSALRRHRAVCRIQSHARAYMERQVFLFIRELIIGAQARVRTFLVQNEVDRQIEAVAHIETAVTRWLHRKRLATERVACILLQTRVRLYLARRMAESRRQSILRIQSVWRGYKSRVSSEIERSFILLNRCLYSLQDEFERHDNTMLAWSMSEDGDMVAPLPSNLSWDDEESAHEVRCLMDDLLSSSDEDSLYRDPCSLKKVVSIGIVSRGTEAYWDIDDEGQGVVIAMDSYPLLES